MSVIRGPNLPPSVTGRLEGHFHLRIKDLKLDPTIHINSGRVAFRGLAPYDYPCFNLSHENSAISVVCPVTTDLELLAEYLSESHQLKIEFLRKTAVVTSVFVDVQETPPEKESDPMTMEIAGRVKGNTIGSCKVSYWFVRQRGIRNSSLIYLKKLRLQHNQNKRRLVATRGQPPCIQTVDQVFDALETIMLEKGLRIIDLYRSCDKLKTPVADLSSLLDRYVEAFIPRIVRQQFWLLLAPSGDALFTSAKFSQQFKFAKQSVDCVKNQTSNGVRVLHDLNRLIKSHTLEEEGSKINRKMLMTESLLKFIEEQFPEASNLDCQIVLAFTFIWIPDRLYWTLNEIGKALDKGLQLKYKPSDPRIPVMDKINQEVKNKDQDSVNGEASKLEGGSTEVARLEDSAKKQEPTQKSMIPDSQDPSPPTKEPTLTKEGILHEMLDTMIPQDHPILNSSSLTQKLESVNFEEGLEALISKCHEVLMNLTSFKGNLTRCCSQSIVPKCIPQQILVGNGLNKSLIGTSEDISFSASLTQSNSTPLPLKSTLSGFTKSGPDWLDGSVKNTDWLKLVFHEVQLDQVEDPFVIIRSVNFKQEFVVSKETVIWIPQLIANKEVVIILEFHVPESSRTSKVGKTTLEQPSRVCGFTKIKLEAANYGECSLEFERFLIKDLFGGGVEKGSLILSLFQSKRPLETNPGPRNGFIRKLGTISNLENPSIDVQTQTKSIKEDQNKINSSTQVENQVFENSVDTEFENSLKTRKDIDRSFIRVLIHSMKLMEIFDNCCIDCYLESDPGIIKKTKIPPQSSLEDPSLILVDSNHEFPVPEHWFDQSLIFKVLEGDKKIIGELHLDLTSLPIYHKISGPMTILNHDLDPTGVLQINVELMSSRQSKPSIKGQQGASPIQSKKKIPFLTCSDDEDYVVLEGVMDQSDDVEIDDLCELLTEKIDVQNPVLKREVSSPELDIFQCDDEFMLDFTKQDFDTSLDDQSLLMSKAADHESDEISVSRISSDQLSRGDGWNFKTSLVPMEEEEAENDESVDIDALLEKYNVRRTPGWWKSLLEEEEEAQDSDPKESKEDQKSDHESSESF